MEQNVTGQDAERLLRGAGLADACEDPPLQPLSVSPKQGTAAHVVLGKSHCLSLDFVKLMLWNNFSGFPPKTPPPGFGYL